MGWEDGTKLQLDKNSCMLIRFGKRNTDIEYRRGWVGGGGDPC